uniref:ABC transporter ATP-binding protein/permease wht-1 n=1 Tax=Aceria tosichella TaxID=561515 RepID=A0A6G1SHU1_9ACAR
MATLTGFKQVSSEQPATDGRQQQQQHQNGQQNPVFVFDEVVVENGADSQSVNEEKFVDAPSQPPGKGGPVAIDISAGERGSDSQPAGEPNEPCTPPQVGPRRRQDNQQQQQQQASKQVQSATGNQFQKTTTTNSATTITNGSQPTQNTLSPNGDDGDNVSVSMLAIDCVGTGKSPRQPRRSPLMALFRGKPRESVRRTYTDEDQFEIEWANLTLAFEKKWYQKYGLTSALIGSESRGGTSDDVGSPEKPKLILNGVDGRIKSGEITAILGPSGAGKTSLLNSLFGKYRTAIHGSIRVTGAPTKKHLTVCTIPQSDFLIGYLTTEESLWFASRLKNCEEDFNHDRNIERVIELLGLQRCRHTRINKLSGGQYKRVSIAQEMLSSPDILVLDEPTSGLDSLTCYRTVKVLRDLVEASKAHNLVNPMSIILTIHQPHREVLDLFHSVYVMAVGGQTLYQGPPSEMEGAINKYSGTTMPTQGYNPASYMVELASEEYGRKPIESLVTYARERFKATTKHQYDFNGKTTPSTDSMSMYSSNNSLANNNSLGGTKKGESTITLYPLDSGKRQDNYSNSNNNKYVDIDLSSSQGNSGQGYDVATNKDIDSRIMTPRSGKNSDGVFWRHVSLMSKRCFLSNTRDPLLCTIRIGAHIFIPLIVALIYGPKMGIPNGCPFYKPEINLLEYASMGVEEIQEKHDDIRVQFQNVGLHFMVYYAFGLCMLAFTAISFPLIMHVLIKEIRNGWYSLGTFIIGKMLAEIPMAIILPPISVGIIYVMTGQPASYLHWRYLVQSLILILIVMIAEAKGLIFGAICMNSMQTAVFAASVSTVPFILLSGFLIRIREVPYILQHLAHFSYFKHSVEALIITRYGFGMCPCDPDLIPPGGTPRIIGIPNQIMSLTDYYINSYVASNGSESAADETATTETNVLGNNRNINRIVESITTLSPEIINAEDSAAANKDNTEDTAATETRSDRTRRQARGRSTSTSTAAADGDEITTTTTTTTTTAASTTTEEASSAGGEVKQGVFFNKLAQLLTRANAFGFSIQSCEDVEPFTMKDMLLKDSMLAPVIGYLFLSIVVMKFISYFIVDFCVKLKL